MSPRASREPAVWARTLFSRASMPPWVAAAMLVRQAIVRLVGSPPAARDVFDIRERLGDEVLIAGDEKHLDFRCAVAVDPALGLVRVTTTVRLHGWRGRAYFAPVRLVHPIVVGAIIRGANRPFERATSDK